MLIVQAPLLTQDPEDVFGVAVALGEEQQLGDLRAARENLGEQLLADRAQHRADLIRRHHAAIQRRCRVGEVVLQGLPALLPREPVALVHAQPWPRLHRGALLPHLGADLIHPEGHIHLVAHGLFVAVLTHHVLVEVGVGVAAGGGGEADDRGVEVIEHLAPEAIDRAVAFIHHDHIEEFRRDPGVIHNRLRPPHQSGAMPIKRRFLLQGRIELGLTLED